MEAKGIAVLYGIYDPHANRGSMFVGVSHETSAFAVASERKSWSLTGVGTRSHLAPAFLKLPTIFRFLASTPVALPAEALAQFTNVAELPVSIRVAGAQLLLVHAQRKT
jgi:hypothetical protein